MNILGIDFEDWFHPELIQKYISKKDNQPKIIQGMDKILDPVSYTHLTLPTILLV